MKKLARIAGRAPKASPQEVTVARSVLAGDDPRRAMLWRQLAEAPSVTRVSTSSGFRVTPDSASEMHMLNLPVDRLESEWVQVVDAKTRRILEFRVVVGRHGFLLGLEGRTTDQNPWPTPWTAVAPIPAAGLALPTEESIREHEKRARMSLERWLGRPIDGRLDLSIGASAAQVARRELELGGEFPMAYRQMVEISDGLASSRLVVSGHAQVYSLDVIPLPLVHVSWGADDRDEFVIALSLEPGDEAVYRLDVHVEEPRPSVVGPDFRDFLRGAL